MIGLNRFRQPRLIGGLPKSIVRPCMNETLNLGCPAFWHVIGHHVYMPSAASLGMTYECHLSRPAKHDKPSLTPYSLTLSCALVTFESSMEPLSRMLLLSKRYRSTLPLQ